MSFQLFIFTVLLYASLDLFAGGLTFTFGTRIADANSSFYEWGDELKQDNENIQPVIVEGWKNIAVKVKTGILPTIVKIYPNQVVNDELEGSIFIGSKDEAILDLGELEHAASNVLGEREYSNMWTIGYTDINKDEWEIDDEGVIKWSDYPIYDRTISYSCRSPSVAPGIVKEPAGVKNLKLTENNIKIVNDHSPLKYASVINNEPLFAWFVFNKALYNKFITFDCVKQGRSFNKSSTRKINSSSKVKEEYCDGLNALYNQKLYNSYRFIGEPRRREPEKASFSDPQKSTDQFHNVQDSESQNVDKPDEILVDGLPLD